MNGAIKMEAYEVRGGVNDKYKLKVVEGVRTTIGGLHYEGILKALETYDEEDWIPCGLMASTSGVLCIAYRRKDL